MDQNEKDNDQILDTNLIVENIAQDVMNENIEQHVMNEDIAQDVMNEDNDELFETYMINIINFFDEKQINYQALFLMINNYINSLETKYSENIDNIFSCMTIVLYLVLLDYVKLGGKKQSTIGAIISFFRESSQESPLDEGVRSEIFTQKIIGYELINIQNWTFLVKNIYYFYTKQDNIHHLLLYHTFTLLELFRHSINLDYFTSSFMLNESESFKDKLVRYYRTYLVNQNWFDLKFYKNIAQDYIYLRISINPKKFLVNDILQLQYLHDIIPNNYKISPEWIPKDLFNINTIVIDDNNIETIYLQSIYGKDPKIFNLLLYKFIPETFEIPFNITNQSKNNIILNEMLIMFPNLRLPNDKILSLSTRFSYNPTRASVLSSFSEEKIGDWTFINLYNSISNIIKIKNYTNFEQAYNSLYANFVYENQDFLLEQENIYFTDEKFSGYETLYYYLSEKYAVFNNYDYIIILFLIYQTNIQDYDNIEKILDPQKLEKFIKYYHIQDENTNNLLNGSFAQNTYTINFINNEIFINTAPITGQEDKSNLLGKKRPREQEKALQLNIITKKPNILNIDTIFKSALKKIYNYYYYTYNDSGLIPNDYEKVMNEKIQLITQSYITELRDAKVYEITSTYNYLISIGFLENIIQSELNDFNQYGVVIFFTFETSIRTWMTMDFSVKNFFDSKYSSYIFIQDQPQQYTDYTQLTISDTTRSSNQQVEQNLEQITTPYAQIADQIADQIDFFSKLELSGFHQENINEEMEIFNQIKNQSDDILTKFINDMLKIEQNTLQTFQKQKKLSSDQLTLVLNLLQERNKIIYNSTIGIKLCQREIKKEDNYIFIYYKVQNDSFIPLVYIKKISIINMSNLLTTTCSEYKTDQKDIIDNYFHSKLKLMIDDKGNSIMDIQRLFLFEYGRLMDDIIKIYINEFKIIYYIQIYVTIHFINISHNEMLQTNQDLNYISDEFYAVIISYIPLIDKHTVSLKFKMTQDFKIHLVKE